MAICKKGNGTGNGTGNGMGNGTGNGMGNGTGNGMGEWNGEWKLFTKFLNSNNLLQNLKLYWSSNATKNITVQKICCLQ